MLPTLRSLPPLYPIKDTRRGENHRLKPHLFVMTVFDNLLVLIVLQQLLLVRIFGNYYTDVVSDHCDWL